MPGYSIYSKILLAVNETSDHGGICFMQQLVCHDGFEQLRISYRVKCANSEGELSMSLRRKHGDGDQRDIRLSKLIAKL